MLRDWFSNDYLAERLVSDPGSFMDQEKEPAKRPFYRAEQPMLIVRVIDIALSLTLIVSEIGLLPFKRVASVTFCLSL